MLRFLTLCGALAANLLLADQSASLSAVYCDEEGECTGTIDGKQLRAYENNNGISSGTLGEEPLNSYRNSYGKLVKRPSDQRLRIVDCIGKVTRRSENDPYECQ